MADQSIDSLSLEIYSSTRKAEDAIDRLVNKLNGLSSSLSFGNTSGLNDLANGVARLTGAMTGFKNSGVGKSDFSNIARSLNQLSKVDVNSVSNAAIAIRTLTSNLSSIGMLSIDTQGIQNIANSISLLGRKAVAQAAQNIPIVNTVLSQLVTTMNSLGAVTFDISGLDSLTASISRLGGKAATNSIPNIQNLTAGLVQMMNTLATAPQVSQNLIQMTQAMAQLASAGGRVSTAANSMQNVINNYNRSAISASKSTRSLVSQLGFMVARFYTIVRVAKGLWNSADSAMNYLETLNYFTQAFNQVASKADLSLWEDYGYASAEAYADSFEKRAKELTKKLTGFEIGDNGNLERTAVSSLGLDPDKTTQYQATFAQMASSMGVTSENALKLSNALTMIGADLASVRNLDFTDVWDDLASGMVGMSRTVDKYGVSTREADLQTQLFKLGIEAKVSALTQADKALLRTITILNSTQYAWADLSETINSPANQLRLLTSNFTALSRTIGSLFLPVITKVLPYINALTIALQRLFAWIGNIAGVDLSGISSAVGGAAVDMGDFADSEDSAAENAKKLKKSLSVLSFDALNQLNGDNDEENSGSGIVDTGVLDQLDVALDDALSRYQEVWDLAFKNMENRANEMAEKIYKSLEPIRKIIEDFKIGDFFQMGKDVSHLVSGIADFFTKAIKKVDWKKIGKNIGDFIAGINWTEILKSIGKLIWTAFNAAIDFYKGMFSEAPFETIILSMMAIPSILKSSLISSLIQATSYVINFGKALSGNATALATLGTQFPTTAKLVDTLRTAFSKFWFGIENGNALTGLKLGFDSIRSSLTNLQKGVIGAVAVFAEFALVKDGFYDIITGSESLIKSIGQISIAAGLASAALYVAFGPAGLVISGITVLVGAIFGIKQAVDDIDAQRAGEDIRRAFTTPGGVPVQKLADNFADMAGEIGDSFKKVADDSAELDYAQENISKTWQEIGKIELAMESGVISVEEGTSQLTDLFNSLATAAQEKFSVLENTLLSAFGENGVLHESYERMGVDTEELMKSTLQINNDALKKIEEITKKLSTLDPTNPHYSELKQELAELVGTTDELSETISEYELKVDSTNVDYSGLLADDNTLDETKLLNFLNTITNAISEADGNIESGVSSVKNTLEQELKAAVNVGDYIHADEIRNALDALPQAMDSLKGDISEKALKLTDTLQNEFVGNIEDVITDAQTRWENMKWYEKLFSGFSDVESYTKDAVESYKRDYVDPVSKSIEQQMSQLGIDGAGWASDATKEIINSLFDPVIIDDGYGNAMKIGEKLNSNYKEIIENATKGIDELAKQRGKDTIDGYNKGVNENVKSSENEMKSWQEKINEAIHNSVMKYGSPSLTAKGYGADTIKGYNWGISENVNSSKVAVQNWMQSISTSISEYINTSVFKTLGQKTVLSISQGINSAIDNITTAMNNLLNKVQSYQTEFQSKGNNIGKLLTYGMSQGMTSSSNYVTNSMQSLMNLVFSYKDQLQSKGNNMGQWLNYGIYQGMNSSLSYITGTMGKIVDLVFSYQERFRSSGNNIGQWTNYGIYQGMSSSLNYIHSAMGNVLNAINGYNNGMYNAGRSLAQSLQSGLNSISISAPSVSVSSSSGSKKSTRNILADSSEPVVSLPGIPDTISTLSGFGKLGISPELQKYASYDLGAGIAAQPISDRIQSSPYVRAISGSTAINFKGSGIDQSIVRDAVAQGFALAMMNNQGNNSAPEYIQNSIYLDGDVIARSVSKAQRDTDRRYNPTPRYGY